MGIQVTTLSVGSVTAPVQRAHEPPPPPVERAETPRNSENTGVNPSNTRGIELPDLRQTASALEDISLSFNRRLKFVLNQDSNELIVKVIDNETDKVIRVLPPEELQKLYSQIRETMGFLFDRMV